MSYVSFVKHEEQNHTLKESILNSLSLIDYNFPKKIDNIVIKPNMCYYWDYSTGQTTDPNFVAALIDLIRDRYSHNVNISIVESDAGAMKCKYAFPFLGYEKLAKLYNVDLVNLSQDKFNKRKISIGKEHFEIEIPETIEKADLKINIPKIKYMSYTTITCALKNIFGCNPDYAKYKLHKKLDEAIVAINKVLKFDICILDGIVVMGNHTKKLNLVMSSKDPVAFDSAASEIIGLNPMKIKHITLANKEGLGNIKYKAKGADPKIFLNKFPKKRFKDKFLSFAYYTSIKMGLGKRLGVE